MADLTEPERGATAPISVPSLRSDFELLKQSGSQGSTVASDSGVTPSKANPRNAGVSRRDPILPNSHPFFANESEAPKPEIDRFDFRHRLVNWVANRLYDFLVVVGHLCWEILHVLVNPVLALLTAMFPVFDEAELQKSGRLRAIRGDNDEELMTLMETQTQTLLEINKFLREEILILKEERDAAETLIAKIETRCRETVDKKEKITVHEILDVLYGASLNQITSTEKPPFVDSAPFDQRPTGSTS